MVRQPRNFDHLVGNIAGLSEKQIREHFVLYHGYVKKLNEIEDKLKSVDPKTANYSFGEISELLRRRTVAHNGAVLHEMYFENLSQKKAEPSAQLRAAIEKDFGSLPSCMEQIRAGLISEPGWVLLTRSHQDRQLRADLVSEHHIGVLSCQDVILALDGWEHAYFLDYATKKGDYISTLERSIDWDIVNRRFDASERKMLHAAA